MMHMTFYWGKEVTLLFDSWNTDTWPSYLLTLFALFLFSAFYQYMEDRRLRFKLISCVPQPQIAPLATALLQPSSRIRNSARFACSILFGLNSALGYLLMLVLMSYNGGVFVAIVLGLAVGYFLFRSGKEDVLVVENACACA